MIIHTGSYLRKTRLDCKKKQREMAELFGVSRGTYSSWESKYKNKTLPRRAANKFYDVFMSLSSQKYINAIIVDREEQIKFERINKYKKESLWKRILKWIMQKN